MINNMIAKSGDYANTFDLTIDMQLNERIRFFKRFDKSNSPEMIASKLEELAKSIRDRGSFKAVGTDNEKSLGGIESAPSISTREYTKRGSSYVSKITASLKGKSRLEIEILTAGGYGDSFSFSIPVGAPVVDITNCLRRVASEIEAMDAS